jgi:hypothetical protein
MAQLVTLVLLGATALFALVSHVYVPWFDATYSTAANVVGDERERVVETKHRTPSTNTDERPTVAHVPLPSPLKAVYMTACVAGTPSFRERLVTLIEETEINAVMIDIKDYSGGISFPPTNPAWQPAWQHSACGAPDMRAFIASLHERGIFVIGRITVFQDPFWANERPHLAVKRADGQTVWHDHKGLSFIEVAAKEYWGHIVALAVESYNLGFDELNFDYVRYPSDGNMQDIAFVHTKSSAWPTDKPANLEAFFAYLHEQLSDETKFAAYRHEHTGRASSTPWTSADLFGMTTTNSDDLSIGQVIERAVPYFDFIAPMVYPSHYPSNYLGLGNPNDHPYTIVKHAMASGVDRLRATTTKLAGFTHERIGTTTPPVYQKPSYGPNHLRTWIQDFDYGGDYDAADVRTQIQASYDAGVQDWMIWAPSNLYTRAALRGPEDELVAR